MKLCEWILSIEVSGDASKPCTSRMKAKMPTVPLVLSRLQFMQLQNVLFLIIFQWLFLKRPALSPHLPCCYWFPFLLIYSLLSWFTKAAHQKWPHWINIRAYKLLLELCRHVTCSSVALMAVGCYHWLSFFPSFSRCLSPLILWSTVAQLFTKVPSIVVR